MNAIVSSPARDTYSQPATVGEIKAQIQLIQRVMREVMIEGVHYGRIPGVPKPSLFKPGAELLCTTFHIAPSYRIDDRSTDDSRRYLITCTGKHQATEIGLGEGLGEASTDESKYKWRAAVCQEEWDETPEDRRRMKWMHGRDGKPPYKQMQVRTEVADTANTVLKMAAKRSAVAMVLNVTAASDIFSQDLEDVPDDASDARSESRSRRGRSSPRPTQSSSSGPRLATEAQRKLIFTRLDQAGMSAETVCARFGIESLKDLPFEAVNDVLSYIADPEREAIREESQE